MYDDDRIVILGRDRLDQRIAIQPSREIFPVKRMNVDDQQGTCNCLPISRVAVHGDVTLARVGLQKYHRNVLLYCSRGRPIEIKVVKEPRKRRMVLSGSRLECLIWLSNNA